MSYKEITNLFTHYSISPATIVSKSLEVLEAALGNELDIVDSTNPFMFLLEASASSAYMCMNQAQVLTRRQYPKLAQKEEDLYHHLSDRDLIGRFAKPSNTNIFYALDVEWIIANAVIDPVTNDRVIYIPAETQWYAAGVPFYSHHDIKIHVLDSGDIQVYFDTAYDTPLSNRSTTLIETNVRWLDNVRLLEMKIPVDQILAAEYNIPVTNTSGFYLNVELKDSFYYARGWIKKSGTWTEVRTTHSDQVYDINEVTMVLKVTEGMINAVIPDIYIAKNMAGTEARLIVYTTKGEFEMDLSSVTGGDYVIVREDYFNRRGDLSSALNNISTMAIYSDEKTVGGRNGLTLEELRRKTVYNGYDKPVAITTDELLTDMSLRGYGIYKQKDTISERVFVTTKELPVPKTKFISSGPGVSNKEVTIDTARVDISNTLIDNGKRLTLKPNGLYKATSFDVNLVSEVEAAVINSLGTYDLCDKLNDEVWYSTPFHYVLDSNIHLFDARAYYLNKPVRTNSSFVNFNSALNYAVKTTNVEITFNGGSYTVLVSCVNPAGLTGLHVQLYTEDSASNRYHINSSQAVISPTESTFTFTLVTNLDIDSDDNIHCSSFMDTNGLSVETFVGLSSTFELIYLVEEASTTASPFDSKISANTIGATTSGVTYDKVSVQLGVPLKRLNVKAKAVLSPGEFKYHTIDVVHTYEKDVYLNDGEGKAFVVNGSSVEFTKTHLKGDIVYEADGITPKLLHKKGDLLLVNGDPVRITDDYISRRVRLMLVDARYNFATSDEVVEYANEIPSLVIESLNDMEEYSVDMIERTALLHEPVSTQSNTMVSIGSTRQAMTNTAIRFKVTFTMVEASYSNTELREAIQAATKTSIANAIKTRTYSQSDLVSVLSRIATDDIINVDVESSLPGTTATIIDESSLYSIRARIIPQSNGTIHIEDAIEIIMAK